METRKVKINNQEINYELRPSRKAHSLRLEIGAEGLVVTKPWFISGIFMEQFIARQADWILKNLAKHKDAEVLPKINKDDLVVLKKRAAKLLIARLEFFNQEYNFKYKSISVRDQKTRWGSCSRQGALNFNYRLALLPESLLDYVAVHELCHLKEMNHSVRFWNLVAITIPDHKEKRKQLEKFRLT
jgi:predicted metal-dependent hydrolase